MENKEILEGNKLIASFLFGDLYQEDDMDCWVEYENGMVDFYLNDELFRYSWDLLIRATQKLFELGWVTVFYGNYCIIQDKKSFTKQEENDLLWFENHSLTNETLHEAVWLSIVECIKYINNNYN